jgi:hypothetical protein
MIDHNETPVARADLDIRRELCDLLCHAATAYRCVQLTMIGGPLSKEQDRRLTRASRELMEASGVLGSIARQFNVEHDSQ